MKNQSEAELGQVIGAVERSPSGESEVSSAHITFGAAAGFPHQLAPLSAEGWD